MLFLLYCSGPGFHDATPAELPPRVDAYVIPQPIFDHIPFVFRCVIPYKNSKKSLITAHMNSIISLSLLDVEALPSYDLAPSRRTGMTHSIIGATARHTRLVGMEHQLAAILSADVQG